ncbi:MAG: phage portal protein [Thauera sp.]|nr:phage portal protein [Thauera sp.]
MIATGYNGASSSRRSLAGWNPLPGSADDDTLADLPTLRARVRDLDRNAPVAGGAINTTVTNVVGTGLSVQPQIDHQALGLSEEQAADWQDTTLREFLLWSESTDCDATRALNFYGLQSLAFRTALTSGDCFAVQAFVPRQRTPIALAIQLFEADYVCNPHWTPDAANLIQGVELDGLGAPVRYYFASAHPTRRGRRHGITWSAVDAFGSRTGRRNVLHLFDRRRPGQTRGVPFLAPVIEPLKQLERYTEAELMAAVVSGMFTVFIQSEAPATLMPSAQTAAGAGTTAAASATLGTHLGNGLVVELNPNEKIDTANPGRPNAQFDPFVTAIIRQIGLLLEIPYEILVKHYQSSYSAAKAAMNDAWKFFRSRRDWVATYFCQPIYETWLEEAVARGRVIAPGFFADAAIRRAWCRASWVGDGPGSLDPLKEALAARERTELTISTLAQESILHDGGDWNAKVRQRGREEAMRRAAGLGPTVVTPGQPDQSAPTEGQQPQAASPQSTAVAEAYGAAYRASIE